jgi:hypothetical protein
MAHGWLLSQQLRLVALTVRSFPFLCFFCFIYLKSISNCDLAIAVASSSGEKLALDNILFGDVYVSAIGRRRR